MGETRKMRDTAAEWCGRERRGDGDAHCGGCMGKKRPQRQRSESDTPFLVKRRPRKEYGTTRTTILEDSQKTDMQRFFHLRPLNSRSEKYNH
jgi:hypothetical protein